MTQPQTLRSVLPLAALVLVINFVTMPAEEYRGDAQAVRVETVALLNEGNWAVPAVIATQFGERGQYFYETRAGTWYPKYGVFNTLIYLPALWLEKLVTGSLSFDSDHVIYLNLLNLILSGATAVYLALLARRQTNSTAVVWVFVLASFYATFWWNYLRAQTFETYFTLFAVAFYYHFTIARQKAGHNRHLLFSGIYLGLLCLGKTAFVLLLPAMAVLWLIAPRSSRAKEARPVLFFWLPVLISVALVLASNCYKFGSAFNTGYTQWEEERELFTMNIFPALWGYFISKQGSLFLHYPLFLFALAGWSGFLRKLPFEASTALVLGLILFGASTVRPEWRGVSCYGPRYLLPVLPILSLPFILVLDRLREMGSARARWAMGGLIAVVLAYSFLLQGAVNSLPFFFWNELYAVSGTGESQALDYLESHHFGTINLDFIRYARGQPSRLQRSFVDELEPVALARMEALTAETRLNYYWLRYSIEQAR